MIKILQESHEIHYVSDHRGPKKDTLKALIDIDTNEIMVGDIDGQSAESLFEYFGNDTPVNMTRDNNKKYFFPKDTLAKLPEDHFLNKEHKELFALLSTKENR
jgi:hypothetical protein